MEIWVLKKQIDETASQYFDIVLSDDTTYSGANVQEFLRHYETRYMLRPLKTSWGLYQNTHLPQLQRAYAALMSEYNPISNYRHDTKIVDMMSDGIETVTRTPDATQNYAENISKLSDKNGENNITTDTYTTVYTDEPKHSAQTVQGGETYSKNVDNMKYTVTTDTEETTLSDGETSYTADKVTINTKSDTGYNAIPSDIIKSEIELRARDIVYEYIEKFICLYTFLGGVQDNDYTFI